MLFQFDGGRNGCHVQLTVQQQFPGGTNINVHRYVKYLRMGAYTGKTSLVISYVGGLMNKYRQA